MSSVDLLLIDAAHAKLSRIDEIDHTALMARVRRRIGDRRVLVLVKAFLKAGILSEGDKYARATITGTPQGGVRTPQTQ